MMRKQFFEHLTIAGIVLACVLAWGSQEILVWLAEGDFREQLIKRSEREAIDLESMTLSGHAMGATMLAGQLSAEVREAAAMTDMAQAKVRNVAIRALNVLANTVGADHAFVVNKAGIIVSDWDLHEKHVVGQDVSHRRYFTVSREGKPSVSAAISISTGRRMFYVAAPIFEDERRKGLAVGAVVLRFEMDKLDEFLGRWPHAHGLLISPEGVVMASSQPGWRMRVSGPLNADRLARLRFERQFGKIFEQPIIDSALPDFNDGRLQMDGRHYLVSSHAVNWNDSAGAWRLVVLGELAEVVPPYVRYMVAGASLLLTLLLLGLGLRAARDKESQRHAEQLLRENERRQSTVLDNVSACIYQKDPEGRYLYVNQQQCDLLGLPREQILGQSDQAFYAEETRQQIDVSDREVLHAGKVMRIEEPMSHCASGQTREYLTIKLPLRDEDGNIYALCGISTDITERKLVEKELRDSKELLQAAAQAGIVGVWDWDLAHNRIYWDPVMYQLYGVDPDSSNEGYEVFTNAIHPEDRERVDQHFKAALKGDSAFAPEYRVVWPDGSVHHLKGAARTEFNAQGRAVRMTGVNYDLTSQKRTEQALALARSAAEAASEAKGQFLANMSHEIRTPMNGILGMIYLALKSELPLQVRDQLSKAQSAAQSLLGLINDILDFSKIEAGKLHIEAVEFSLESVITRVTETIAPMLGRKPIEFMVRYDPTIPPFLIGDPLRLGQILVNLCGNAVKFTEQGEIELSFSTVLRTENSITMQVSVRDTGIGMNEQVQQNLFEKFMQADQSTTRRFGGSGLGLAICKSLAEQMGGRAWVEASRPGLGTTMCFTTQLQLAADQPEREALTQQVGDLLKGTRALVVDDLASSRDILSSMLGDLHMDVRVAASGAEALLALERAKADPFDLVLMDWRMPGMNGDEVIRRIHGNPLIVMRPKVIMVTAYGREDVMRLTEQAGAEGFLVKPAHPSTLLDTVLSVLGKQRLLHGSSNEPAVGVPVATANLAGATILLVEDNEINREFAVELLRSQGMDVLEASNGQQAVEIVQRMDVDAVLMDLQMPVMGGLEAARSIRQLAQDKGNKKLQDLPIIAMTALAMAGDAQRSLESGMSDHVTKPVDPEHLLAVLGRWISPSAHRVEQHVEAHVGKVDGNTLPSDLDSLRMVDVRQGLRRIGDSVDLYRKQLHRFREHFNTASVQLDTLLEQADLSQAAAYVHTLKGVLGNLGYLSLLQLIESMDASLRAGHRPEPKTLVTFNDMWADAMAELDQFRHLVHSASRTTSPALGVAGLKDVLVHLATALAQDLGAASEPLKQLIAGVDADNPDIQAQVDHIAQLVDIFDIDGAQESILALQTHLESS